jgi:small ligand-binding sensory domain FIST
MVAHLAQEMDEEPARLALYFNCLARGVSLYRRPNVDTSILREFLGNVPMIGLNGNAEIAPVRHRTLVHNYTGALVVI